MAHSQSFADSLLQIDSLLRQVAEQLAGARPSRRGARLKLKQLITVASTLEASLEVSRS